MSETLTELARRIESSPEGSRWLDWSIAHVIGLPNLEWDDGDPTYGPINEPPIIVTPATAARRVMRKAAYARTPFGTICRRDETSGGKVSRGET